MKINRSYVLFIISVFLFAFSLISRFFSSEPSALEKSFLDTSILKNQIIIELSHGSKKLTLEFTDGFWFARQKAGKKTLTVTADTNKAEGLLSEIKNTHNLYKISDINSTNSSDLTPSSSEKSYTLTVIQNSGDKKILSEVNFYGISPSTGFIYLSDGSDHSVVYETKNSFSSYLNDDISAWADGSIFAEIKNAETSQNLIKYRHSNVISFSENPVLPESLRVSSKDQNGRVVQVVFYPFEEDYICRKIITPSASDSQKLKELFRECGDVYYEISAWSFMQIKANAN